MNPLGSAVLERRYLAQKLLGNSGERLNALFGATEDGALLTEQFGTSTRTSGASLGYQIAAALGGFAPLLAAALVGWLGWLGASLLYMLAAVIGLIGILVTRETYGRAERARVNALVEEERARLF